MVQDAIFSRPPQNCAATGIFIGGKDINLALEMMGAAKRAMVPPFEVSTFADPGGSFTTAAAMVACVERVLARSYRRPLKGLRLSVFGATGVVGFASSVLAALEGARVRVVAHESMEAVEKLAGIANELFGVDLEPVAGMTEAAKGRIVRELRGDLLGGLRWRARHPEEADRPCRTPPRRRRRQCSGPGRHRGHGGAHGRRPAARLERARHRPAGDRRREVQDAGRRSSRAC